MLIINLIANIVLTLSGMIFFLQLYGKASSVVHKWDLISHWSLKFGLSVFVVGSFFNVLTLSRPNASEVLMNVGLAALFTWAVMFHYKIFSKYDKKD